MYADIAVDAPIPYSRTFSYSLPENCSAEIGQLVWVPFGSRIIQGIIVNLTDTSEVDHTRPIVSTIEPGQLVSSLQVSLGLWISKYYLSPVFNAISLFLPPGFKSKVRSEISPGSQIKTAVNIPPAHYQSALQVLVRKQLLELM